MKNFILVALMSCSLNIYAGDILIHQLSDAQFYGGVSVSSEFEINEELGRAWVKTTLASFNEGGVDEFRTLVEGLSFDVSTKAVTILHEGQLIDCAFHETRGRGIFSRKILKPTGRCEFVEKRVHFQHDNGFEIEKKTKTHILLRVR